MCQITAVLLSLFVAAPLLLGSCAFNTVGTSGVSWPTSKSKTQIPTRINVGFRNSGAENSKIVLRQSSSGSDASASEKNKDDDNTQASTEGGTAATNTINERLMAELQEAEETERFGAKGKKLSLVDGFGRTRKSDAEMKIAIAEARDLNGVNPLVAIGGSFFAFGVAAALWIATNKLGGYFASNPPDTEVYFVVRTAQVFRNVVMGMISLASGFFGVTGLGIFGMGVRVGYGVMTGELDPTPIKTRSTPTKESVDMGNMMDLMMNKKPGRRGGGKK